MRHVRKGLRVAGWVVWSVSVVLFILGGGGEK